MDAEPYAATSGRCRPNRAMWEDPQPSHMVVGRCFGFRYSPIQQTPF